jgi:hypothetical protein
MSADTAGDRRVRFEGEIDEAVRHYEKAIGSAAMRTWRMIEDCGYIDAVNKLMITSDVQKGFRVISRCGAKGHYC